MPTTDRILGYMRRLPLGAWLLRGEATDELWRLIYVGPGAEFSVYLTFTESWAFAQAPLLKIPPAGDCVPGLQHYLLRANDDVLLSKLGIDSEGQIVLSAEWPLALLDFEAFRHMLESISIMVDRHAAEIRLLSWDPWLAAFALTGKRGKPPDLGIDLGEPIRVDGK